MSSVCHVVWHWGRDMSEMGGGLRESVYSQAERARCILAGRES